MKKPTQKYTIEDNIPIPPVHGNIADVMRSLNVGQSFLLDRNIRHATSTALWVSKKYGGKFSCRTVDGGTRVWRVS